MSYIVVSRYYNSFSERFFIDPSHLSTVRTQKHPTVLMLHGEERGLSVAKALLGQGFLAVSIVSTEPEKVEVEGLQFSVLNKDFPESRLREGASLSLRLGS